jgi:hypothetical protein
MKNKNRNEPTSLSSVPDEAKSPPRKDIKPKLIAPHSRNAPYPALSSSVSITSESTREVIGALLIEHKRTTMNIDVKDRTKNITTVSNVDISIVIIMISPRDRSLSAMADQTGPQVKLEIFGSLQYQ